MKTTDIIKCTTGFKDKCINATTKRSECHCACGGRNHGALRIHRNIKQPSLFEVLDNKTKLQNGFIVGFAASRNVFIHQKQIFPNTHFKIHRHTQDGFNWGHNSSGSSQLAFAILLNLYDRKLSERFYREFKKEIITELDKDKDFKIPTSLVHDFISMKLYINK